MKKFLKYLSLTLLLASCEKQTQWDLQVANNDFIVVDGIITSELKFQTLKISKPMTQINEVPQPVKGATILVSAGQQVFSFHENSASPGLYISDIQFNGISNQSYSLFITSGSKIYSAKADLAPPIPASALNTVQYVKVGDNQFKINKVQSNYNPEKPAMFEFDLDWSAAPGYENSNEDLCKAKLYFYTLPTIDVSEVFAPGIENVTFPAGTIITQRRYSLTSAHAAFLRALLLETTWSGGYFNTASANIPTNVSEGAKGFFGACGIIEMSQVVK